MTTVSVFATYFAFLLEDYYGDEPKDPYKLTRLIREIKTNGNSDTLRRKNVSTGLTPLLLACNYASYVNIDKIIKTILRIDPIVAGIPSNTEMLTPLMFIAKNTHIEKNSPTLPKIVNMLLKTNMAYPNAQSIIGYTALMYAIGNGMRNIIEPLCKNTTNINAQNVQGNTALMLACGLCNSDIIDILMSNSNIDVGLLRNDGKTALMISVHNNCSLHIIGKILSTGQSNPQAIDNDGNTALLIACKLNKPMIAYMIASVYADNALHKNNEGMSAIHYAKRFNMVEVLKIIDPAYQTLYALKSVPLNATTIYDIVSSINSESLKGGKKTYKNKGRRTKSRKNKKSVRNI